MNDEIIKNAQYRKGLSIAFFNAINNATEIVKLEGITKPEEIQERISFWRDWLLEEHKNYYATVIEGVGKNYNIEDSIEKLKNTNTLEELTTAWLLLSEDERRDPEIRKVAGEQRRKYNEKA